MYINYILYFVYWRLCHNTGNLPIYVTEKKDWNRDMFSSISLCDKCTKDTSQEKLGSGEHKFNDRKSFVYNENYKPKEQRGPTKMQAKHWGGKLYQAYKIQNAKISKKKENLKSSEEIRNMRDKRNKGENYKLFLPNYASIR